MTCGERGSPVAAEALDLELYQLACTFAASQEFERVAARLPRVRALRHTFELSEAARRLIAVAVTVRSNMDASGSSSRTAGEAVVGTLVPDLAVPAQTEPLGLREACNKVIHADTVDFRPSTDSPDSPLESVLHLFGTKGKQEWRAELDVLAFVVAAYHLA